MFNSLLILSLIPSLVYGRPSSVKLIPRSTTNKAIDLRSCRGFAANAGVSVTFAGRLTTIPSGSVGAFTSITGPASYQLLDGTSQVNTDASNACLADLPLMMADAWVQPAGGCTLIGNAIDGLTLTPGVYCSASALTLAATGILTLDAQGDKDAVFIFQAGSAATGAANSQVLLVNGASEKNVFWVCGSAFTLAAGAQWVGTAMVRLLVQIFSNN